MTPVNGIMILLEAEEQEPPSNPFCLGSSLLSVARHPAVKVLSPQINLATPLEVVRGAQFRICGNRKMKKMSALSSGHVFYGQVIGC